MTALLGPRPQAAQTQPTSLFELATFSLDLLATLHALHSATTARQHDVRHLNQDAGSSRVALMIGTCGAIPRDEASGLP